MKNSLRSGFAILITLSLGVLSALLFSWLSLPLPWMLGPLFASAITAFSGVRVAGKTLGLPSYSRLLFVPIIGVMIGSRVSSGFLDDLAVWWPSLLLVVPYMIAVQLINSFILQKFGGYDRVTAFFAASPGGLIEAVLIGEKNGGNTSLMAVQHFARVSLSVMIIPILLSFVQGAPVGSAAGVMLDNSGLSLSIQDILLLGFSALAGAYLGQLLRLPAAIMVGPFLFSAVLHASGITEGQIPATLVMAAQLVVGTSLGMQFAGPTKADLVRGIGLSLVTLSITLTLAFGAALLTAFLGMAAPIVGFIAFAPGGLVEMGLIAISLHADPVFVAAHHVLRIGLAVTLAPILFKLLNILRERRGKRD